jgi:hypothetical protein
MSTQQTRILAAFSGILGIILLGVYFLAAPPLPPADATVAQVTSVATQYHNAWLLGAWLQATGSLLSVVVFLALVHMAGGAARLAGTLTLLGSAVLLGVTLIEGVFTIDLAQATANGHPATALSSYDLIGVFIHIFPLAPAPIIFLSLGAVLLGSRILPGVFGYLALALGIAYEIVGFVGLFTTPILTLVVLGLQSLWVVAAAITLVARAGKVGAVN